MSLFSAASTDAEATTGFLQVDAPWLMFQQLTVQEYSSIFVFFHMCSFSSFCVCVGVWGVGGGGGERGGAKKKQERKKSW